MLSLPLLKKERATVDLKTIKCLSVKQPWASLIVHGIKTIENRRWPCKHRGPLLIHAGKTQDENAYNDQMRIACDNNRTERIEILSQRLLGGFVGVCVMTDCVSQGKEYDGIDNWFAGPYGFVLDNARPFKDIIRWRGQLSMFNVRLRDVPGLEAALYGL
jgi:hypothetical protein